MKFNGKALLTGWIASMTSSLLWAAATGLVPQASAPARPVPTNTAEFVEVHASAETLVRLRRGGYVLFLRHGLTDSARADRIPKVDLNDCQTQRPLTEAGREQLAAVGAFMRRASIPIGEFRVSPMCRARESAAAAFPNLRPQVDEQLMYVANFTDAEKTPIIANTRRLLSLPVPPGENRLVLAHAPNLMEVMGYFPKEGTLVILRPKGETSGFEYVASVLPTAWKGLVK